MYFTILYSYSIHGDSNADIQTTCLYLQDEKIQYDINVGHFEREILRYFHALCGSACSELFSTLLVILLLLCLVRRCPGGRGRLRGRQGRISAAVDVDFVLPQPVLVVNLGQIFDSQVAQDSDDYARFLKGVCEARLLLYLSLVDNIHH